MLPRGRRASCYRSERLQSNMHSRWLRPGTPVPAYLVLEHSLNIVVYSVQQEEVGGGHNAVQ